MMDEEEYIEFKLENGILIATYKAVFVTLDIAKSVLEARNNFVSGHSYPMLVDASLLKGVDKDARDYFGQPKGSAGLIATALFVNTRFNYFFVNFLIKVNLYKSPLPIKAFYNYDEAIAWLEQFK